MVAADDAITVLLFRYLPAARWFYRRSRVLHLLLTECLKVLILIDESYLELKW